LLFNIEEQQKYLDSTKQELEEVKQDLAEVKDEIANMDRYFIVPIDGIKYKYEVRYYGLTPTKFTDIESARQFVLKFINDSLKFYENQYTELKNREEQISANIVNLQNQLQQLESENKN